MTRRFAVRLVHWYRLLIGRHLPPMCRFQPSCSHYAESAFQEHGVLKGGMLAIWRLVRCNPWGEYGWDPVPVPGAWRQAFRRRPFARTNRELAPGAAPDPGSARTVA
ncbi:MAG: membrane protein insertion efficiency factor YidD [bacterium]